MLRFLPTFLFFCTISLSSVLCFCIYNEHSDSTVINVFQTEGQAPFTSDSSRFRATDLTPGNKQCCHFSNPECNGTRKPDSILRFGVRRKYSNRGEGIFDIDCPAGGFIIFTGDTNIPNIAVFNADRSQYNFSFSWRPADRQFLSHHNMTKANANNFKHVNSTGQIDHLP